MNATTQGTTAPVAKRERQFIRTYDHANAVASIQPVFNKDGTLEIALAALPDKVLHGFALMAVCDYVVNEANDALKNGPERAKDAPPATDEEKRVYALSVLQEAFTEAVKGQIDFRSGTTGLGSNRSAIKALGQALFELGKTFVLLPTGEKITFTDIAGAQDAAKSLYNHTEPVGEKKLSGRMVYNAIMQDETVKAKVDEIRKVKPSTKVADISSYLGSDAGSAEPQAEAA